MAAKQETVVATINSFLPGLRAAVEEAGLPVAVVPFTTADDAQAEAGLRRAEVVVTAEFRARWLGAGSRLRLIQVAGAGTDGIEIDQLPPGVAVCNVFGHEYGVAEHVFLAMAALNRELTQTDNRLRLGDWGGSAPVRELRKRRLCIVGLGRIGTELARWGAFYNMRLTGATRRPERVDAAALRLERLTGLDELPALAAEADFLVNTLPRTRETTGLIGFATLSRLPATAYVVNVGRGPVIDEVALFRALRDGRIAGAAIDVWYRYPEQEGQIVLPSHEPFHELDNVILTPHKAGYTDGTMRFRWAAIAENIRRLQRGEPLVNVVWPEDDQAAFSSSGI